MFYHKWLTGGRKYSLGNLYRNRVYVNLQLYFQNCINAMPISPQERKYLKNKLDSVHFVWLTKMLVFKS